MMTGFLPFFRFTVYTLLRFIIIIVIKWACPAADPAPTDPPAAGPTPTDPPATLHKEF